MVRHRVYNLAIFLSMQELQPYRAIESLFRSYSFIRDLSKVMTKHAP